MIKCIIFDLDNTLYREAAYLKCLIEQVNKKLNISFNFPLNEDNIENLLNRREKDILRNVFQLFFKREPSLEEHNLMFDLYKNIKCEIKLFDDAEFVLNKLKNTIKMGILTNGIEEVQRNKIRLLSIEKIFDKIFITTNAYPKPTKEAFKEVIKNFNLPPELFLFVGDDPINDINGAKNIGMKTYRVRRGFFKNAPSNADYEFSSLLNILNIIRGGRKWKY